MNEKNVCLLYFDILIHDDSIGRVFIEAVPSSKSLELISFFRGSPSTRSNGTEGLAKVVQVKSGTEVHFEWSSEFESSDRSSSLLKDCVDASTTAYAEGAGFLFCDREFADKFCITASPWLGNLQNPDSYCLVGRVYKGMSFVNYLASTKVDPKGHPLKACRIVEIGFILPGESLGLKPPEAILDTCPSSPSDAVHIDFTNIDEVIKTAYGIKTSASILFREGKYSMAKCKFEKAIRYITFITQKRRLEQAHEIRMLSLIVPCILDCATCKLKMKDYDGALEDCNEALEINPGNAKIYFRRGQAYHGKLNYEQSLFDLEMAKKISPNNKPIHNEIVAVKAEMQVYKKSNRRRTSDNGDSSPSMDVD